MTISRDYKNVGVLAMCQALFMSGLSMQIILSGLVGAAIAEDKALATLPISAVIIASTLTTLAVFLPVLFVQQEAGQLFRDIALAISSAVGLSLIVSITLIPMAAARLFRTTQEGQTPDRRDAPRTHDDGNGEPDGHDKSATVPPGTVSPGTVSPGTVPTAASPSMRCSTASRSPPPSRRSLKRPV